MIGSFWFNSYSAGGGGAAADYELISTTVLGSSAASVTFSGLGTSAAAYKHLQLRITSQTVTNGETILVRFNSDSASNYRTHSLRVYGTLSSVDSGARTSLNLIPDSLSGGSVFTASVIDILDWASTSKNKVTRSLSGYASGTYQVNLMSGLWLSTAAIDSITLPASSGNIATGSRFSLYGLRG